jgi:uncharacterized protein (TIGR03382 family)
MKASTSALRLLALIGLLGSAASAQILVNSVATTQIDAANTAFQTVTFNNTQTRVDSLVAGSLLYEVDTSISTQVFIRRSTNPAVASLNDSRVWYRTAGNNSTLLGNRALTLGDAITGNDLFRGANNLFTNDNSGSNIERVDLVWSGGVTFQDGQAISVFDRNAANVGSNAFQVALITAVDGSGTPTAYSNVIEQADGWGLGTDVSPAANSRIFNYEGTNDDTSGAATIDAAVTNNVVRGILFRLEDFGIAPGTVVYGYSLMDIDVSNSPAQLLDWDNASAFPIGTANSIDLAGVNGIIFTAVPEPSTFGIAALAALGAGQLLRRRRSNASLAAPVAA